MNALNWTAVKKSALHVKMAKRMYTFTSSACHSYRPSSSAEVSRAFPQYTVYTPTCLLQVKPTPPTFKKAGLDGIAIDKPGRMLLEFIPAKKQQQYDSGKVSYDYNAPTKGMLSMSVEEIGTFLAKTTAESKRIEFRRGGGSEYNSNNVASADEYDTQGIAIAVRQTEKTLTILPEESGDFHFNFSVRSNADEAQIMSFSAPISQGEMEVLKCLFRESIPHLTGWGTMIRINDANYMKGNSSNNSNQRFRVGGSIVEEEVLF